VTASLEVKREVWFGAVVELLTVAACGQISWECRPLVGAISAQNVRCCAELRRTPEKTALCDPRGIVIR